MKAYVYGCNLCKNICPANKKANRNEPMEAYACWSLDSEERKTSSSGGIASIFYNHFLENKNGIAYGCYYDSDLKLKFHRATTKDEILKFKTSKYSMPFVGNTFKEIRKDLQENKYVVFVGSPCQVAGLKNFLQKDYDTLLCMDLICHGEPPQQYLSEYVEGLKLPEKPDNLTFRGVNDFKFTLYNKEKIIYSVDSSEDKYYQAFFKGVFYRENCYTCDYASKERVGDLTIGDFWGLGDNKPFNHDKKDGVSVVLVNSIKGKKYFEEIKDKLFYEKRDVEEAILGNPQLSEPVPKTQKHFDFLELYHKYGLNEAINRLV